jgi:hypothetical protein
MASSHVSEMGIGNRHKITGARANGLFGWDRLRRRDGPSSTGLSMDRRGPLTWLPSGCVLEG